MTESTIQIKVDATQGRAELRAFASDVGATVTKLGQLRNAAGNINGGGFAALGAQIKSMSSGFQALKNITGGVSAARELRSFSTAAAAFRAPSSAQIANITSLARALKQFEGVKVSKFMGGDIASLGRGLEQLHVPSSADIARLPALVRELQKVGSVKIGAAASAEISQIGRAFSQLLHLPANSAQRIGQVANALNSLKVANGSANALAPLTQAVAGIRGPSTATVNNLASLVRVLSTANVAQVNAMTSALQRLNGLNLRASVGVQAQFVRPVTPPPAANQNAYAGLAGGTGQATNALHGLTNQFNLASIAASAFGGILAGLSFREFGSQVLDAGNKILGFKLSMDAIATTPTEAGNQLAFLTAMSSRTGTQLESNIDAFTRFAAAARTTGATVAQTQRIYESFSTAFAVMHVSAQRQNLAFLALQEMWSKDQVQKQQAIRQLATELPGAAGIMAQALGMTTKQLEEHFKKGDLDPGEVQTKMADVLMQRFGSQLPEALKHSQASINQLHNSLTQLKNSVFESGFDSGLSAMVKGFTTSLNGAGIEDLGKRIGGAFQSAFVGITALGQTAMDYAAPIGVFAGSMASLLIARQIGPALALLRSPIVLIGGAAVVTYSALNAMGGGFADLAAPASIAMALLLGVGSTGLMIATGFGVAIEAARLLGAALSEIMPTDWTAKIQASVNSIAIQLDRLNGGHTLHDLRVAQGFDTPEGITDPDELKTRFGKAGQESGKSFGDGFSAASAQLKADIAALSASLGNVAKNGVGSVFNVGPLKALSDHLAEATKRAEELGGKFHGLADYQKNLADELERNRQKALQPDDAQKKLLESLLKSDAAAKKLREDLDNIAKLKGKEWDGKPISNAQIAAMSDAAKRHALKDINPTAGTMQGFNDQLQEQIAAYRRAADGSISFANALEQEKAVLDARNKALAAGAPFAEQDADALRKMVSAMQAIKAGGNDGISQWVNGLKSFKDATNDAIKNGVDKLSDSLAELAVNGTADFRSLAQGILKEFAKIAIQNIMKDAFSGMGFGNMLGTAQNALKAGQGYVSNAMGALGADSTSAITVATQNVQAAVVNINGAGVNALGVGGTGTGVSGLNAFGSPNSTSISDVNVAAVGGLKATDAIPTTVDFSKTGIDALASTSNGFASVFPLTLAAGAGAFAGTDRSSFASSAPSAFGSPPLPSTFTPFGASMAAPSPYGALSGSPASSLPSFSSQTPASLLEAANDNAALARAGIAGTGQSGLSAFSLNGLNPSQLRAALMAKVQADFGVTQNQAAGVVGNLSQETNGFRNFQEMRPLVPGSRGGYGLAQWTGARRRDFEAFADQQGKPTSDLDTQYGFFKQEMNGRSGGWTGNGLAGLRQQGSLEDSTRYFRQNFERPGVINDPARLAHAHQSLRDFDANPTGSIGTGQAQLNQAMEQSATKFQTSMQSASASVGQSLTTSLQSATSQAGQSLTTAIGPASSGMSQLSSAVTQTGSAATGATSGLGSLIQQLASMGGGGGSLGGVGSMLGGMFSEGGYSNSPVAYGSMHSSAWHGAPHYSEGTPNTSGGIPAVLHDNEAVIPLSRGRSIPVEMRGGQSSDASDQSTQHFHFNFPGVKDFDSFKRSQSQVEAMTAAAYHRTMSKG